MRHTWLVEPGNWRGEGLHRSANGEIAAFGEAVITHEADRWVNDSYLTLRDAAGTTWRNRYEFPPRFTPVMPFERGHYAFVDEAILVTFPGGCETLVQLDADHYRNFGVVYDRDICVATWQFDLLRKR